MQERCSFRQVAFFTRELLDIRQQTWDTIGPVPLTLTEIQKLITLLFIITFAKSAVEILIQETLASIAQAAFQSAL